MAGEAYFYHLTHSDLGQTLATLLGKCRAAGWRVTVKGRDPEQLDRLDDALWQLGGKESFLPHGRAGGAKDAKQPILLVEEGHTPTNKPDALICIAGADLSLAEVEGHKRAMVLFHHAEDAEMTIARGLWKTLSEAGCTARYWSEESGRWAEKARSG